MTNYKNILHKNNQLINIININNNSEEYLLFIYYTCCILGGYESIDYLLHLLVFNIIKCIEVDLELYYPNNFDIELKMNETLHYYNYYSKEEKNYVEKFIKNLKYNNKLKQKNNLIKIDNILLNTISLRGFNQKINYGKVYWGNINVVKNYFINNRDYKIMKKIIKIYKNEDILKIFKIYFQVPQLMHSFNNYKDNRDALMREYNFCISNDNYKKTQNNCIKRNYKQVSNLITGLINYGDCRELALTLEFYYCIKEWIKYMSYLKDLKKNENKIIKLIKNQKRIINMNIYFNACYADANNFASVKDFKIITNEKGDITYNNKNYMLYENHNFVIKMKKKKNSYSYKCSDIMYNKYDVKLLNTYFIGDYLINDKKPNIKFPYVEFGTNDYNNLVSVVGKIVKVMFKNFTYINNLDDKLLYLSNNFNISKNFYDINQFVKEREDYYNKLRKKYYNGKIFNVEHYTKNSKYLKYFLLEDL
jgi:hypothetical protein